MSITPILSDKACAYPAGLFNHAKIFQKVVYTTGQIGGDVHGNLVSENIAEQARQMFKNLEAILHAADSSLDRVLCANIFLVDPDEYKEFNAVYLELMKDPKPPRTCVFVKSLPANARCEMNLVAAQKE